MTLSPVKFRPFDSIAAVLVLVLSGCGNAQKPGTGTPSRDGEAFRQEMLRQEAIDNQIEALRKNTERLRAETPAVHALNAEKRRAQIVLAYAREEDPQQLLFRLAPQHMREQVAQEIKSVYGPNISLYSVSPLASHWQSNSKKAAAGVSAPAPNTATAKSLEDEKQAKIRAELTRKKNELTSRLEALGHDLTRTNHDITVKDEELKRNYAKAQDLRKRMAAATDSQKSYLTKTHTDLATRAHDLKDQLKELNDKKNRLDRDMKSLSAELEALK